MAHGSVSHPYVHNFCHAEIRTRGLAEAIAHYRKLGWATWPLEGLDFALCTTGGEVSAGIFQPPMDAIPLGITPYILVEDAQRTAEKAESLGGRMVSPRIEAPGQGAFVTLLDPWGNDLSVWEDAAGAAEPPPPEVTAAYLLERATFDVPTLEPATAFYHDLFGWTFRSSEDRAWEASASVELRVRGEAPLEGSRVIVSGGSDIIDPDGNVLYGA